MTSAHQPSAYSHGEPLVGRDRELGTLRAHLDAALVGRGSLVLVGGAAGIGKTTLAEALCAEATARGASLLVGRCYDLTETPPYGPWAEVLARTPRHGDDLPDPPDLAGRSGATSEAAIFAAVRDHLIALAARQPLVLLLEDLHWADPASLDLLRALARGLADATLLLLATYRAEEVRRQHRLYALLPTLVREARADRLDLRPLGDDDLRALVRARHALTPWDEARLVAYLGERSGGNPLFAGELLRALAAGGALRPAPADGEGTRWTLGGLAAVPVPALLRQVIDARVARLGEGAYRLLGLAATIGQEVPLALWRVAGAGDDEMLVDVVGRAVAAGVLAEVPDSGGVRFVHALIREALYEGVPLPRRQAWHRRIGEALLTAPAPDPDAVADHFRRAGDARAYDWLVLAGHRAYRASARSTASDRYEAALESAERLGTPPGERAWLLFRLSGTTWFAPTSSRARSAIDVAAALAEEAGERALLACARWWRGFLECHRGRLAIGVAGMAAGVADLEALAPADAAVLRARMEAGYLTAPFEPRGWLVEWLAFTGYYARAVTLGAQVLAGAPVDRAGQDYALAYKGMAIALAFLGRVAEARAAFAEAHRANRADQRYADDATTVGYELALAALPYAADRPGACRALAEDEAEAMRRMAAASPDLDFPPVCSMSLQLLTGDWDDVVRTAERLVPLLVPRRGTIRQVLGWLARARGDTTGALAHVRVALPDGRETAPGDTRCHETLPLLQLAAALALDTSDQAEARAWLECHDRWLVWSGAVPGRAEGALGWAAYHRAAGDFGEARACAEAALAHASDPHQPLALLAARRLLGELATTEGRRAAAQAHLDRALALAVACAAPYERALTLLPLAEAHLAGGEPGLAQVALDEARTILGALGAAPALARAAALAARLAAAPPRPPAQAAYPAGLSAREVEVLRLVAEGLTDAQVAAHLGLSRRTVSQHLRSIYNKLDVPTRTAAARFAIAHGLA
jgi:DNA-binding CsgD family transcriptional regulator